jgi:hypothetical protein
MMHERQMTSQNATRHTLAPELVAWKSEHDETCVGVLLVEDLEMSVLAGEAAGEGREAQRGQPSSDLRSMGGEEGTYHADAVLTMRTTLSWKELKSIVFPLGSWA